MTNITNSNNLIFNLKNRFMRFIYSDFYPLIIGLVCLLFFSLNLSLWGLTFIVLTACVIFLFCKDMSPILPLLFFCITVFRTFKNIFNLYFFIIIGIAGICFILHLIIYRSGKIKGGKLLLPLIAVTVALFTNGLFSPYMEEYKSSLISSLTLGVTLNIVYLFFRNYMLPPKTVDIRRYFAISICTFALISGLEMFFAFGISGGTTSELGWANTNTIATVILIAIPFSTYLLSVESDIRFGAFSLILDYILIFFSGSDGCLGISVLALPLIVFYLYKYTDKVKFNILLKFTFIIIITLLLLLIFSSLYSSKTKNYLNKLFDVNGRFDIYANAVSLFLAYPVFGVGLGFKGDEAIRNIEKLRLYNFHSTILHVMATMGIVGIIAYVFYFKTRFKILSKDTQFNRILLLAFVIAELYGLIDTVEFNAIPCMIILTVIIVFSENEKGEEKLPLRFKAIYNNDKP